MNNLDFKRRRILLGSVCLVVNSSIIICSFFLLKRANLLVPITQNGEVYRRVIPLAMMKLLPASEEGIPDSLFNAILLATTSAPVPPSNNAPLVRRLLNRRCNACTVSEAVNCWGISGVPNTLDSLLMTWADAEVTKKSNGRIRSMVSVAE